MYRAPTRICQNERGFLAGEDYPLILTPHRCSRILITVELSEEGLKRRGHETVLVGPDTTRVAPSNGSETYLFKCVSYPTHPDVKIGIPGRPIDMFRNPPRVDLIHSQATSHMGRASASV